MEASAAPRVVLKQVTDKGFVLKLTSGEFVLNEDGSITIADLSGAPQALVEMTITTSVGQLQHVEYELTGNKLRGTFTSEAHANQPADGEALGVVALYSGCDTAVLQALGGYGVLLGSALTAPATFGGSLLVGGAALTSLGISLDAVRKCYA
ncbi:hypothetical protein GCM10027591_11580 [Zhihengliuella somnathii]